MTVQNETPREHPGWAARSAPFLARPPRDIDLRTLLLHVDPLCVGSVVRTESEAEAFEQRIRERIRDCHLPWYSETASPSEIEIATERVVMAALCSAKYRGRMLLVPNSSRLTKGIKLNGEDIGSEPVSGLIRDWLVRFVAWADPPGLTQSDSDFECGGGLTTHPDHWASNAVETLAGIDNDNMSILDATWSPEGGPIYVAEIPAISLMIGDRFLPYGLCANIEFDERTYRHSMLCTNARVNGVSLITYGGCNPANYPFFPCAQQYNRRISNMVCYAHKRKVTDEAKRLFLNRPRITTKMATKLFPNMRFETNHILDHVANGGTLLDWHNTHFGREIPYTARS